MTGWTALAPWREISRAGHEIGNHTIGHPCSKALFDDPNLRCLESMTLAEIEADIVEASRRLREGIPEQADFSFCYPCYQEHVGEGLTRQSYVPVVARHFIAGRGQGERGPQHPRHLRPGVPLLVEGGVPHGADPGRDGGAGGHTGPLDDLHHPRHRRWASAAVRGCIPRVVRFPGTPANAHLDSAGDRGRKTDRGLERVTHHEARRPEVALQSG